MSILLLLQIISITRERGSPNRSLYWTKIGLRKSRTAEENSKHPQWNTLPGQQRHASDKPFRCLQCPPDFQFVSKETRCVPESIHQIRPERKQCESPRFSIETCRQVITEKVSLALCTGAAANSILPVEQLSASCCLHRAA